jgi:hypothetical protein
LTDLALDNDLDSDDEDLLNELGLGPDSLGLLLSFSFTLFCLHLEQRCLLCLDLLTLLKMVHEWQQAVESPAVPTPSQPPF